MDKDLELEKLALNGIKMQDLKKYNILFLPENFETNKEKALIDVPHGIDLSKHLKSSIEAVGNSYDLNLETEMYERRSEDFWLGLIVILQNQIISQLSGDIYNFLKAKLKSNISDLRKSNTHVHLRYIKNERMQKIDYEGDPETLIRIMNNLDDE